MSVHNTYKDLAGQSFNLDNRFDFDSDLDKNDYGSSLSSQFVIDAAKKKSKDSNPPSKLPKSIVTMGDKGELEFTPVSENQKEIVCYCDEGDIMTHYECSKCGNIWCPEDKEEKQLESHI